MTRPVYGITVLRYEDGRTELQSATAGIDHDPVRVPEYWQHAHAMLIDACELVKREAGVEPAGKEDA